MSASRTEIAGVSVIELARQFGTPTFVYDAAMIRPADRRPGRLRRRPLCPKGLLEPGHSRSGPPRRRTGRCGQRRRDSPRLGRRLCAPRRRSPADRLHGRHLRRRVARPVRGAEHPRQLRLARHDRPARRPRAGQAHHPADQSRLRPRPQPKDQHRRQAGETRHLARANRRVPGSRQPLSPDGHRPAHAHRLRHRSGASLAGVRGDGTSGRRSRAVADFDQRRRRAAHGLPAHRLLRRSGGLLRPLRRHAEAACRTLRPRVAAGDRAGPIPRGRERLPGGRDSRRQAAGRQHVLPVGRRLQQPRPADPLRLVSSDVDRAGRRRHAGGPSRT